MKEQFSINMRCTANPSSSQFFFKFQTETEMETETLQGLYEMNDPSKIGRPNHPVGQLLPR
jgi:hypothetical protein